jgi:ATP-dependent Clp protease adaptor protein ClpS
MGRRREHPMTMLLPTAGTDAATETESRTDQKPRLLPPYHVLLHNDDHHSLEFVIAVLREVFRFDLEQAFQLTRQAHDSGRAIVYTGAKERAEFKAEQIRTFHEKKPDGRDLGPLECSIEPAS